MRGKTWVFIVVAGFVAFLGAALGCSSAPAKATPVGDTVTISFDGTKLAVDNIWAVVDQAADMKWKRAKDQSFQFEIVLPENTPFDAAAGRRLKSKDQDDKSKWHGVKEWARKDADPGRYHYLVLATIDGVSYVLDPEIIVPRPGKG